MTLVDTETGALEWEIEIVPGRMIVWANRSLSHKVDVVDAGTPCVMLVEGPTSPRIVTGKQHSKAYVDVAHCTVNTLIHINTPIT
jgi:hypothetical protein